MKPLHRMFVSADDTIAWGNLKALRPELVAHASYNRDNVERRGGDILTISNPETIDELIDRYDRVWLDAGNFKFSGAMFVFRDDDEAMLFKLKFGGSEGE